MDQPSKPMTPDEMATHQALSAMRGPTLATTDEALQAYVAHRTSIELANAIRDTLGDVLPDESVRAIADQWASDGQFTVRDGQITTKAGVPAAEEVAARLRNQNVAEALLNSVAEHPQLRAARVADAAARPAPQRGFGLHPIRKRGA